MTEGLKDQGGPAAPALNPSHTRLWDTLIHRHACANAHPHALHQVFLSSRHTHLHRNLPHLLHQLHPHMCYYPVRASHGQNRAVALEHVSDASRPASGGWVRPMTPWPLTVKLTLPPVGCCAKCQEWPLILSRCLVGHSAPDYLSCPDQSTYIPASAQLCCWLCPSKTTTYFLHQNTWSKKFIFFDSPSTNKTMQPQSFSFELKLLTVQVGEKWDCKILPQGWKSAEGRWN